MTNDQLKRGMWIDEQIYILQNIMTQVPENVEYGTNAMYIMRIPGSICAQVKEFVQSHLDAKIAELKKELEEL